MNFKKFIIAFISLICFTGIITAYSQVNFSGHITCGTSFTGSFSNVTADVSFGMRLGNIFYIGPEVGIEYIGYDKYRNYYHSYCFDYDYNYKYNYVFVPVGLNAKLFFCKDTLLSPYITATVGGFFGMHKMRGINGFRGNIGIGMNISYFTVNIGYIINKNVKNMRHLCQIKAGVCF